MAAISFDRQSLIIDNRRHWLVSGTIHYARTPAGQWRARLRAAREAGLNCIETYVFWNAHEPEPGKFVFKGDLDLQRFVQMVGEEGMFCYLRPGPYVCAEWDWGGLPAWLRRHSDMPDRGVIPIRQSSPAFLEATARYFAAVMEQVADLQLTTPPSGKVPNHEPGNRSGQAANGFVGQGGGPIALMQVENEWFCHNDDEQTAYHQALISMLRQHGCSVPITACNQLWQTVDGTIHTWNASSSLAADMRQLAHVQPEAPRIVSEYWTGWFDHWDGEHAAKVDPQLHSHRLAQIAAAGAMSNQYMFHGGTNFGFYGGRTVSTPACYMTTSYDYDAPLHEAGGRGEKYDLTKRFCMFQSQFAHVLANLDPGPTHATVAPADRGQGPISVTHQPGSQGGVVYLLAGEGEGPGVVDVLLPSGLTLPVDMGQDRVAWIAMNVNLHGTAELTYTNLRPWALLARRLLVLFGPAGGHGLVCIDGEHFDIEVPATIQPHVEQLDDLTIVVLNCEQVDATYISKQGLHVGCAGIDEHGDAVARPGFGTCHHVAIDGTMTSKRMTQAKPTRPPKLSNWMLAKTSELLDGSSDAYQPIDGPASHAELGCDLGYVWYRINGVRQSKSTTILAPGCGDRLAIYDEGKLKQVLGQGPHADYDPISTKLPSRMTVLSDNLGRFNYGMHTLDDLKGLWDHIYQVTPIKLAKPKVSLVDGVDPFELSQMIYHRRKGDARRGSIWQWTIKPTSRKPIVLDIASLPRFAVVQVNDVTVGVYDPGNSGKRLRLTLDPADDGPMTGGSNQVSLVFEGVYDDVAGGMKHINVYQTKANLTSRASWSYARWSVPQADAFATKMPKSGQTEPTWWRCEFDLSTIDAPLWLEPRGMSKGQIIINGHNAGRYWMSTHTGKSVGPQSLYYLPEAWLRSDEPNELILFDEHGKLPSRCRLVANEMGPYGQA